MYITLAIEISLYYNGSTIIREIFHEYPLRNWKRRKHIMTTKNAKTVENLENTAKVVLKLITL